MEFAIGKSPGWVYCWLDASQNVNRCQIFNRKGERLSPSGDPADLDDVFVPFDGDGPVPSRRLVVDRQHTSWQYVALTDGTFLIRPKDRDLLEPLISPLLRLHQQSDTSTTP